MAGLQGIWEQEAVAAYERGRPAPPTGLVGPVLGGLGIDRRARVLDLAAGTGKFTRSIVPLVGQVIAVEPSTALLSILQRECPGADARVGVAEDLPLPDGSVDAVCVAEAFHWFDVDAALGEIRRVLRPGGWLILVSHRQLWWDAAVTPWVKEFDGRLEPFWQASVQLAGEHPNVAKRWRARLSRSSLFGAFQTSSVEFCDVLTADEFVDLVASFAWIGALPAAERVAALAAVRDLVAPIGELTLPYRTDFEYAQPAP